MPNIVRSRRQWEAQADLRVSKGEPGQQVEHDFVAQGLDPPTAQSVVDRAISKARTRAAYLLIGSLAFAFLGFVVTVVSFLAAPNLESRVWVWYGPIIAGGITAIIAFIRLVRVQR